MELQTKIPKIDLTEIYKKLNEFEYKILVLEVENKEKNLLIKNLTDNIKKLEEKNTKFFNFSNEIYEIVLKMKTKHLEQMENIIKDKLENIIKDIVNIYLDKLIK